MEDSRNNGILERHIDNQVSGWKLSGKITLYVELGKKYTISRGIPEFQIIPGRFKESWNETLKILFKDKYWVGKLIYILKLAKTNQIQGIPGFLDVWIPGLKNQEMLPKVHIIIPLSWIYTKCVKFSKLLAISREIPGFQIIPGRFQG